MTVSILKPPNGYYIHHGIYIYIFHIYIYNIYRYRLFLPLPEVARFAPLGVQFFLTKSAPLDTVLTPPRGVLLGLGQAPGAKATFVC